MASPGTAPKLLAAAAFGLLVQRGLVTAVCACWPTLGEPLAGSGSWLTAAPVLSAGICVLTVAARESEGAERVALDWLPVLLALPLLLGLGAAWAGMDMLRVDQGYLPGRSYGVSLVALARHLPVPLVHMALATCAPLGLLAWLRREAAVTRWAVVVFGLIAGLTLLVAQRSTAYAAAVSLRSAGLEALVPDLDFPGWGPGVMGLGLVAAVLVPRETPRVGRLIWLVAPLAAVDPVHVVLGWALETPSYADAEALPRFEAPAFAPGGNLLDLTGSTPRLNGHEVTLEQLGRRLVHLGHGYTGGSAPKLSLPGPRPWPTRVRASLRLALPVEGVVRDVTPPLRVLASHGVREVQWIGRPAEPVGGPLRRALRAPGFTVLLDVPANHEGRLVEPVFLVVGDSGRLVDLEGRCGGEVAVPDGLEALDRALETCPDGLLVLPSADTPLARVHRVLDRLGGTGRRTLSRASIGLLVEADQQHWLLGREKPSLEAELGGTQAVRREGFGP